MKHLKKRDNYLQQLNERRKWESQKDTQFINEAFKNEIKWGDSLLGKLVNWVIRKIGIGAKLLKMPAVVNALKQQFDNLIATSSYSDISKDQQIKITEIQISEILKALANAVESGEEVKVLIEMTTDVIDQLKSLKVVEESEEKKKDILERLEKFLEFLNSLKEETKSDSDSDSGEDGAKSGKMNWSNSYTTMIKNLTALQLLLTNYKSVKLVDTSKSKVQAITHIAKAGDTLGKIQKDTSLNKDGLTLDEIIKINSVILSKYIESAKKMNTTPDKINLAAGTKIILSRPTATGTSESLIFEADVAYTTQQLKSQTGNPKGGQVQSSESHATQAFKKLLVSIQNLENPKEKGYAITSQFIMDILNNKKEGKSTIKNFYREILRFLIGDKKATLNAPADPLYKESFQTISDKNKVVVVAEKIARFSKRALQFDGENLYGSYGNLATPLKDFVESLKLLMKIDPKELTGEKKQESRVFGYSGFIRLIKEADDATSTSDKIKEYFNENLDIDAFIIEETEARKIEQEIEDKAKSPKELIIRGMNPIIEIVRIFNRAYKIHTTAIIPVGTTDGKVNAQTWAEYTAFGYSSGEPSATENGPYRNNKIFNQWEQGVFDILADTKYAPIFAVGTKVDDGSGNIKEGAGVALRQLMLDLLDGDNLYKGDRDGGAQKAALNKYFGDVSKDYFEDEPKEGYLSYKGPDGKPDLVGITDNTKKITTSEMKFTSAKNISESLKDNKFRGTIFCVPGKNSGGKIDNLYVYVYYVKGTNYFALVSETLFYLRKIIQKYQPSMTLDKGDLGTIDLLEKNSAGVMPLMSTMVSASTLQKLKDGTLKSLTVNSVFKDVKDGKEKTNTLKLTEVKIPSFVVKELDKPGEVELFKAGDEKKNNEVLKGVKSMLANISVIETTGYGDDKKFKAHTTGV